MSQAQSYESMCYTLLNILKLSSKNFMRCGCSVVYYDYVISGEFSAKLGGLQ